MGLINKNRGTIIKVSKDRMEVTIKLPKGGAITGPNEGFSIGDRVCYILDTLEKRITKILPEDVANVKVELGQNPFLSIPKSRPPKKARYEKPIDLLDLILSDKEAPNGLDGPEETDECTRFEIEGSTHRSNRVLGNSAQKDKIHSKDEQD